jgi:hypothetical protein
MKPASALREEYSDVVTPEIEDDLIELVGILDAAYALETAPVPRIAPGDGIAARSTPERSLAGSLRRLLPLPAFLFRRSAAVALGLAAALILGAAGYATAPLLERAFNLNTGTHSIVEGNLGRPLHLSASAQGFRLTLDRAYADAGKIVIGFDLTAPPIRHINSMVLFGTYSHDHGRGMNSAPVLTDNHGDRFSGGLAAIGPGVENGRGAGLLEYDPAGLADDGVPLHLHLHASAILVIEQLTGSSLPAGHSRCEERTGTICIYTVRGAFDFKFTVPITPSRVARVNRSSTVGGTTVKLERVVTAPTGTTVTLRGTGPYAHVSVTAGGKTYSLQRPFGLAAPDRWSPDSEWQYVSGTALTASPTRWAVTVRAGARPPRNIAPHATILRGGPWTFRFTMPAESSRHGHCQRGGEECHQSPPPGDGGRQACLFCTPRPSALEPDGSGISSSGFPVSPLPTGPILASLVDGR